VGIVGAWFAYGDSWGPVAGGGNFAAPIGTDGSKGGNCETTGMHPSSACSVITAPPPSLPSDAGAGVEGGAPPSGFPQTPAGSQTFCLSGTAAQVIACVTGVCTGSDYSNIFGIGIGLDFNNPPPGITPQGFDAVQANVVGVSFTITGAAAVTGGVRVEFPTTNTATACSGGCEAWNTTITTDGPTMILFSTLTDTIYMAPDGQPPLSSVGTSLQAIQFHVPTNTSAAIPVADLCVSNLSVILSSGAPAATDAGGQ
jgi:hypothetical protein